MDTHTHTQGEKSMPIEDYSGVHSSLHNDPFRLAARECITALHVFYTAIAWKAKS